MGRQHPTSGIMMEAQLLASMHDDQPLSSESKTESFTFEPASSGGAALGGAAAAAAATPGNRRRAAPDLPGASASSAAAPRGGPSSAASAAASQMRQPALSSSAGSAATTSQQQQQQQPSSRAVGLLLSDLPDLGLGLLDPDTADQLDNDALLMHVNAQLDQVAERLGIMGAVGTPMRSGAAPSAAIGAPNLQLGRTPGAAAAAGGAAPARGMNPGFTPTARTRTAGVPAALQYGEPAGGGGGGGAGLRDSLSLQYGLSGGGTAGGGAEPFEFGPSNGGGAPASLLLGTTRAAAAVPTSLHRQPSPSASPLKPAAGAGGCFLRSTLFALAHSLSLCLPLPA